jgi:hypothetical protein
MTKTVSSTVSASPHMRTKTSQQPASSSSMLHAACIALLPKAAMEVGAPVINVTAAKSQDKPYRDHISVGRDAR